MKRLSRLYLPIGLVSCLNFIQLFISLILPIQVNANTKLAPHLAISHCYHWLDEKNANRGYLAFKYDYAAKNEGELSFYTTPASSKGAVAGAGIYCAKSPSDSYAYGDRMIRIELTEDVVMLDEKAAKQYCGYDASLTTDSKCQAKAWDIKFYSGGVTGDFAWYVIRNPSVIKMWSATSDQVIADLLESKPLNDNTYKVQADKTINAINEEIEKYPLITKVYYNNKARVSLIDLFKKDPSQLSRFPSLMVISTFLSYIKNKGVDGEKLLPEIENQIARTLKDQFIAPEDLVEFLKTNVASQDIIFKGILKVLDTEKENINQSLVLTLALNFENQLNFNSATINGYINNIYDPVRLNQRFANVAINKNSSYMPLIKTKVRDYFHDPKYDIKNLPKHIDTIAKLYDESERLELNNFLVQRIQENRGTDYFFLSSAGFDKLPLGDFDNAEKTCKHISALFIANNNVIKILFKNTVIAEQKITSTTDVDNFCSLINAKGEFANILAPIKDKEFEGKIIKGRIEDFPFVFLAQYLEDVQNQCGVIYDRYPGDKNTIDEINYNLNDRNNIRHYNTGGYWGSKIEVCTQLINSLSSTIKSKVQYDWENDVKIAKSKFTHTVYGTIEDKRFVFTGDYLENFQIACFDFYSKVIVNKDIVDNIDYNYNNDKIVRLYQKSSYWNTKELACSHLLSSLATNTSLRWRADLDWEQSIKDSKSKFPHVVYGDMQSKKFNFSGQYMEEIEEQCGSFYLTNFDANGTVDLINAAYNDEKALRHYKEKDFWSGKNIVCSQITSALAGKIAYKADIDAQKDALDAMKKYPHVIYGNMQGKRFSFYNTYYEDLEKNCNDFYKANFKDNDSIDKIVYKYNDQNSKTLYNQKEYWKSKAEVCAQILVPFNKIIPEKVEVDWLAEVKNAQATFAHVFYGKVQGKRFLFNATYLDDVDSSCKKFLSNNFSRISIDSLDYAYNNAAMIKKFNNAAYWDNAEDICGPIKTLAAKFLRSKADVDYENTIKDVTGKYSQVVTGDIQTNRFVFAGENIEEIKEQCLKFSTNLIKFDTKVDRIRVRLNQEEAKEVYNEKSYWVTGAQICQQFQEALSGKMVSTLQKELADKEQQLKGIYRFSVRGKLNSNHFLIWGNDLDELNQMCKQEYAEKQLKDVEIKQAIFSVNGLPEVRVLVGSNDYCEKIKQQFKKNEKLLMTLDADLKKKLNDEKNVIYGLFAQNTVIFSGQNLDEILTQCRAQVPDNKNSPRYFNISYNRYDFEEETVLENSSQYSSFDFCDHVLTYIAIKIPADPFAADIQNYLSKKYPLFVKYSKEDDKINSTFTYADNVDNLKLNCESTYSLNQKQIRNNVDITLAGFSPMTLFLNKKSACDTIADSVSSFYPNQKIKEKNESKMSDYQSLIYIKLEGEDYYLKGNSPDELVKSCKSYEKYFANKSFFYTYNLISKEQYINDNATPFCAHVRQVSDLMYTDADGKFKNLQTTNTQVVQGRFEHIPYTFKGDTLEDLRQQCFDFFDSNANLKDFGVDDIYFRYNKFENDHAGKFFGRWEGRFEVCEALINQLKKKK
jgi:hypothetical protein